MIGFPPPIASMFSQRLLRLVAAQNTTVGMQWNGQQKNGLLCLWSQAIAVCKVKFRLNTEGTRAAVFMLNLDVEATNIAL